MIRLASDIDDTYEPYIEPTNATIPTPDVLCGIKVSSGGNYVDENGQQWITDEIVKYADGSGKRIKRIFKHTVSECIGHWGDTLKEPIAVVDLPYYSTYGITMCNRFAPAYEYLDDSLNNVCICSGDVCLFRSSTLGLDNEEEWTSWFAENETIVYGMMETPIITDLTAEEIAELEKVHTFYSVTHITNDSDCGMSVTYMADVKNYIDNRFALLEAKITNNN
jgi:hypothetical protein